MLGHTRRLVGVLLSVIALMVGAAGLAGSASAAPYTTQPVVSVSNQTPTEGSTLTVSFQGFLPGENVRIELHSQVYLLATVRADANGAATATVTLPAGVTGNHTIVAIGTVSGRTASVPITILAQPASSVPNVGTQQMLPRTGLEVVGIGALATGLLVVGGILLLVSGRRRRVASL